MTLRLAEIDMFAGLSETDRRAMAEQGHEVSYEARSVLAEEGMPRAAFHLVLAGSADVEVHGEHRGTLQPGAHFGEISLIDGAARSATVRAGPKGVTTFGIAHWAFTPILQEHPEVALHLLKVLCARLRAAESKTETH